jgi:hypothetical protein
LASNAGADQPSERIQNMSIGLSLLILTISGAMTGAFLVIASWLVRRDISLMLERYEVLRGSIGSKYSWDYDHKGRMSSLTEASEKIHKAIEELRARL